MIEPRWNGRRLVLTLAAQREMDKLGADLWNLADWLERGRPSGRKRADDVHEICCERGESGFKVVCVDSLQRWADEPIWLVIHVGTYPRR